MPRKYVKKGLRNPIDPEKLAKAIKEVEDGNLSVRKAATAFKINYSSLQRHTSDMQNIQDKPEASKAVESPLKKNAGASLGAKPVS